MKRRTSVSILIPVFNRQEIVDRAIESALNQTYEDLEIIIVDNASTDRTWEKILHYSRDYPKIRAFRNEHNIGPVGNWRKCLEYSSGDIVKFIWSDDWIDDNYLEETTKYLEDEEIAFVFSPAIILDKKGTILNKSYQIFQQPTIIDREEFVERSLFGGNVPVSPGCAAMRREDAISSLVTNVPNKENLDFSLFGAGNDLLMLLLPLLHRRKVAFTNLTNSYFLHHEGSFSVSNRLSAYYDWAKLYFLEKLGNRTFIDRFKTKHELKRILGKGNKELCHAIPGLFNLRFGVDLLMSRLRIRRPL